MNAANEALVPGGGVCGAIHRAAGPELARACATLGGCPTGEARLTPGFRLSARFVIHAVGPVWHGGEAREAELLASAYRSAMELAADHALRSIAFPAISTGIHGYPLAPATEVAVRTVRDAAVAGSGVQEVVFACFSPEVLQAYRQAGVAAYPRMQPTGPVLMARCGGAAGPTSCSASIMTKRSGHACWPESRNTPG